MYGRAIGPRRLGRVGVAPVSMLPLHCDPIMLAIAEHACVLSHASIALTGTAARLRAVTSLPHESYLDSHLDTYIETVDDNERTTA
jgi:hypothetical protein